ncbi:hypothetical protein ACHQM5_024488 [Ranunculus cassubicifolius]
MEVEIDHYQLLGLPSGEEGSKLTQNEISKAYRSKALELHPDKRRNDPNAHDNFQKLKSSYEILKDEKARKLFDDLLRVKLERRQRQSQCDSKRRKMMNDLDERERASFSSDPNLKSKLEEERIAKEFREEIERIRAMQAKNKGSSRFPNNVGIPRRDEGGSEGLDGEKVLKVSWDGTADDYTSTRLKELFEEFGEVEDVVIQSGRKKKRTNTALVVMATKDAAVSYPT